MTNVARIDRAPSDNAVSPARPANADGARPAVAVEGVSKRFASRKGEVHAVDNVSLSIGAGEFVAILGPSGCGKSTLLNMIDRPCCRRRPAQSQSLEEPVNGPVHELGIVFQQHLMLGWRTILNNVMLQIEVRRLDKGELQKTRAEVCLSDVGLGEVRRPLSRRTLRRHEPARPRRAGRWSTIPGSC